MSIEHDGTAGSRRFPAERRVRRRADFQRIQARGRRVNTAHFVILVAAQRLEPGRPSRLGLVVTRKLGGAVVRNRIKRVCRECFRLWPDLAPPGIDLVVIARAGAENLGLNEVRAEWSGAAIQLRRRSEEALAQRAVPTHVSVARGAPPRQDH